MDSEARQSGLIADTYPERVEPVEVSPRPSDPGNDRETSPLPVQARSCAAGLGVLQPGGRVVLADFPDLVPFRLTISERPTPQSSTAGIDLCCLIDRPFTDDDVDALVAWCESVAQAIREQSGRAGAPRRAGAWLTEAPLSEIALARARPAEAVESAAPRLLMG